jgi:Fe-S-cluster containining protein
MKWIKTISKLKDKKEELKELINILKEYKKMKEENQLSLKVFEFKCQRCGNCCKNISETSFHLTPEEVEKWKNVIVKSNFGTRPAIDFVSVFSSGYGDIFISPITRDELIRCPFLRKLPKQNKYKCLIYDSPIRPQVCKDFPFTEDGKIRFSKADICPEVRRLKKLSEI